MERCPNNHKARQRTETRIWPNGSRCSGCGSAKVQCVVRRKQQTGGGTTDKGPWIALPRRQCWAVREGQGPHQRHGVLPGTAEAGLLRDVPLVFHQGHEPLREGVCREVQHQAAAVGRRHGWPDPCSENSCATRTSLSPRTTAVFLACPSPRPSHEQAAPSSGASPTTSSPKGPTWKSPSTPPPRRKLGPRRYRARCGWWKTRTLEAGLTRSAPAKPSLQSIGSLKRLTHPGSLVVGCSPLP